MAARILEIILSGGGATIRLGGRAPSNNIQQRSCWIVVPPRNSLAPNESGQGRILFGWYEHHLVRSLARSCVPSPPVRRSGSRSPVPRVRACCGSPRSRTRNRPRGERAAVASLRRLPASSTNRGRSSLRWRLPHHRRTP